MAKQPQSITEDRFNEMVQSYVRMNADKLAKDPTILQKKFGHYVVSGWERKLQTRGKGRSGRVEKR